MVLRFATGGLPRERRQSPLPRDPCRPSRRAPSFRDAERERPARIREMPANAAAANMAVLCPMGRRPRGGRRPDPHNNADRVHGGARISALAEPSQVLVSQTVEDLVAGSEFTFEPRASTTSETSPTAGASTAPTKGKPLGRRLSAPDDQHRQALPTSRYP